MRKTAAEEGVRGPVLAVRARALCRRGDFAPSLARSLSPARALRFRKGEEPFESRSARVSRAVSG